MDINHKALLGLVRQSQFGMAEGTVFDQEIDWDAVCNEAIAQTVVGIVAPEVPREIYSVSKKWQEMENRQLAKYIRYLYAEEELVKIFETANIPFVIIKGNAAAMYYAHPERREMGDIDFIVPQDLFYKAVELMINNGYTQKSKKITTSKRHVVFVKRGIDFELHHHYGHNDADTDERVIEELIAEGIKDRTYAVIRDHKFPVLPRLLNGLVLLDHMRSHMVKGLGIRQVIDWMMFVNKELTDDFWNESFQSVAKKRGLDIFAITVTRMCQLFFGLPAEITWCRDADEELCRELMETLLYEGNFGMKLGDGRPVEGVYTQIKKRGLLRWLQRAGELNWNAYKKHRWLKPFCWLYQSVRYARLGLKAKRSYGQLRNDRDRGKNKGELLDKLGI